MRIATMAPAAALLFTVSACSWGSEVFTTSDDERQPTQSPTEDDSGGDGGSGGSGDSGGSGGDGGQGGQPEGPATNVEEEPTAEEEEEPASSEESTSPDEGEPTDGPIMLALGESHRFEDGFIVTMSSAERLTEPEPDRSGTSTDDEPLDEAPTEEGTEDVDEPSMDDEASEESEEEGDDYYAWSVEIANGTGEDLHTGSVLTSCAVGSPLTESSAPLLGTALDPLMALSSQESGSWDEDCWADEDDPTLQWTLEFIDEQGRSLHPVLIFEGRVG